LKVKPQRRYIPRVRFQYKIWWFVTSRGFEYGIFILIIINTLTLAMKVRLVALNMNIHRSPPLTNHVTAEGVATEI